MKACMYCWKWFLKEQIKIIPNKNSLKVNKQYCPKCYPALSRKWSK